MFFGFSFKANFAAATKKKLINDDIFLIFAQVKDERKPLGTGHVQFFKWNVI